MRWFSLLRGHEKAAKRARPVNTETQLAPSGDRRQTSIHDIPALLEQAPLALGQALEKLPQRDQQVSFGPSRPFWPRPGERNDEQRRARDGDRKLGMTMSYRVEIEIEDDEGPRGQERIIETVSALVEQYKRRA
jgi:hypothetical protein